MLQVSQLYHALSWYRHLVVGALKYQKHKMPFYFIHYLVYQLGTSGHTQEAEPVRGAYP